MWGTGLLCPAYSCLILGLLVGLASSQDPACSPALIGVRSLDQVCIHGPSSAAQQSLGCSLYRLCNSDSTTPPLFPSVCNTTKVSSLICLDDASVAGAFTDCATCVLCSLPRLD